METKKKESEVHEDWKKYNGIIPKVELKSGIKPMELLCMHPNLFVLFAEALQFAEKRKLPFVVTSIIRSKEENDKLKSKSNTHVEGRAFDLSVNGWRTIDISDLVAIVGRKHSGLGAISAVDKVSRPVVVHDSGYGMHFHFQCRG